MTLINYLRKNGEEDVEFYHLDYLRPTLEEALEHIVAARPDIFAISAVVSTAYAYSKNLANAVKEALPDTLIILGGNMGASAEVLLRKTAVDLVCLGEGEKVLLNMVRRAKESRNPLDFHDIKGLGYINAEGVFVNTGYEMPLDNHQMYDVDWADLEKTGSLEHYMPVLSTEVSLATEAFNDDPRIYEPERRGKRLAFLYTSKGCVSRCTFCHRWDKGLRTIPIDIVMQRLDELVNKYNIGFIWIADENFGADRRWLKEFCKQIKKYNIIWIAGSRVTGVTPEFMAMLKESGCALYGYGIETGSERMLQVMEKKTTVEENYRAIDITHQFGINAVIALVLGMPGETPETIAETMKMCQHANTLSADMNPNDLSINYAQALPGTSLYEYGRHNGLIGKTLEGEEEYLLTISDRDAHDEFTTINFTDYPALIAQSWRPLITIETNFAFVEKFGIERYLSNLLADMNFFPDTGYDSGYFANPRRIVTGGGAGIEVLKPPRLWPLIIGGRWGLALICYPVQAHRIRRLLPLLVLAKGLRNSGVKYAARLLSEYLAFRTRQLFKNISVPEYKSLRKIIDKDLEPLQTDSPAMAALRRGR
jgi:radical SAM superfamily enzyme YgiQ (UPF0313 family)